MKKRLLTAVVGLGVAVAWMFCIYVPVVFSAILAVVALIAEYEMLKVFDVKNLPFRILCMATSAAVVLLADFNNKDYGSFHLAIPLFPMVTAVVLLSLVMMVLDFEKLKFDQVVCSLFCALLTSEALATIILMRDVYITWAYTYNKTDGVFFILFAFFCSWMSDGCAYFAGRAFGKHKLAPKISPKKTVEGLIGGVIGNEIFCGILWLVMNRCFGLGDNVSLAFVLISAPLLSLISVFGDLAASTIKRHHGIKDFGNLLPGHGGVMDRFDSSVFVFTALYGTLVVINSI